MAHRSDENWRFKTDGCITSSPISEGGLVYFGSWNGYFYALHTTDGKEAWRFKTQGKAIYSPTIHDNYISFTCRTDHGMKNERHLYILDRTSGNEICHVSISERGYLGRNTSDGSEGTVAIHDGKAFFSDNHASLYEVDIETGKIVWQYKYASYGQVSSPAIHDGKLIFCVWNYTKDSNYTISVDSITKKEEWKTTIEGRCSAAPNIINNIAYFGTLVNNATEQCFVYGIDVSNGKEKCKFITRGVVFGPPVLQDKTAIFADFTGYLYAVDIDKGTKQWEFYAKSAIVSSPVIYRGIVCLGCWNGRLITVDVSTGKRLWWFRSGKSIVVSPSVNDKAIYFGNSGGNFFSIPRI